jgi:hypothetical protein
LRVTLSHLADVILYFIPGPFCDAPNREQLTLANY